MIARLAGLLLLLLGAAGCAGPMVTVGSKDFAENRILAEMFALLLEDAGLRVQRRIPTGDTRRSFAALQAGAIDVYPEYTGTAMTLLGLPPGPRRDAVWAEVQAAFQTGDLRFLPRLGFQSTYAVLATAGRAAAAGLETVEDLAPVAGDLRLGVTETYARRPRDGLQPFLDGFGLDFAEVGVVPGNDRQALYEGLVEGRFDAVVGFATDPQVADYGLVALEARAPFFPAYDAAPLASEAALARAPRIEAALSRLAGRLSADRMRALNKSVDMDGRAPREVAAEALAELGLIEGDAAATGRPFRIAAQPGALGGDAANRALRAVRQALPERGVAYLETLRPVSALRRREARLAFAPLIVQFDIGPDGIAPDPGLEAVAAVGSSHLHALMPRDIPGGLAAAEAIATGPAGSASYRMARAYARSRAEAPGVLPRADLEAAARAVLDGDAQAVIATAATGRPDVAATLTRHPELALVDAAGWWRGATRLELPFLREARIPAGSYPGQGRDIDTLALQLALIGPAPPRRSLIGRQGPSTYSEALHPLTDDTVRAISEALGPHPAVDPSAPSSAALAPQVRGRGARLNPHPDRALISVAVLAFAVWAGWLLVRR